jgi:UDP-N-acetyl-D-galactosamine dehydrogenase
MFKINKSNAILEKKICIVGLGYVGLPLLKLLSKKFNVTGFDNNKLRIKELKKKLKKKKK